MGKSEELLNIYCTGDYHALHGVQVRDFFLFFFFLVQLAFAFVIYPCLVVQYMGQAAFLSKNLNSIQNSFYDSIPG